MGGPTREQVPPKHFDLGRRRPGAEPTAAGGRRVSCLPRSAGPQDHTDGGEGDVVFTDGAREPDAEGLLEQRTAKVGVAHFDFFASLTHSNRSFAPSFDFFGLFLSSISRIVFGVTIALLAVAVEIGRMEESTHCVRSLARFIRSRFHRDPLRSLFCQNHFCHTFQVWLLRSPFIAESIQRHHP